MKMLPDRAEVQSVGTSENQSDRVTQAGGGFQTKPHDKMTTWRLFQTACQRRRCGSAPLSLMWNRHFHLLLLIKTTARTCQVASQLSQVSAKIIKLDLCRQEDVLRFRQWERALVCAGILVAYRQIQNISISLRIDKSISWFIFTRPSLETEILHSQNMKIVRIGLDFVGVAVATSSLHELKKTYILKVKM